MIKHVDARVLGNAVKKADDTNTCNESLIACYKRQKEGF